MVKNINEIAIICPSRGRNDILKRCISSWKETTDGLSDFYVILDKDDADNYEKEDGILYRRFEKTYPSDNYNKVYNEIIGKYNYFFGINDDVIFRTNNWEKIMISSSEEFNFYGMVFPNDGTCKSNLCAFQMYGYKAAKILGWFCPTVVKCHWADHIVYSLFSELKLMKYVDNVLIEHMHCVYNKAESDTTYKAFLPSIDEDSEKRHNWIMNEQFNCVSNFIDKMLKD